MQIIRLTIAVVIVEETGVDVVRRLKATAIEVAGVETISAAAPSAMESEVAVIEEEVVAIVVATLEDLAVVVDASLCIQTACQIRTTPTTTRNRTAARKVSKRTMPITVSLITINPRDLSEEAIPVHGTSKVKATEEEAVSGMMEIEEDAAAVEEVIVAVDEAEVASTASSRLLSATRRPLANSLLATSNLSTLKMATKSAPTTRDALRERTRSRRARKASLKLASLKLLKTW